MILNGQLIAILFVMAVIYVTHVKVVVILLVKEDALVNAKAV